MKERELTQEEEYDLMLDYWVSLQLLRWLAEGTDLYEFHLKRKEYLEEILKIKEIGID